MSETEEIGPNEYRCAACEEVFEKGRSDAEAAAEATANGFDGQPCEVVCDDCYHAIMAYHSPTPENPRGKGG